MLQDVKVFSEDGTSKVVEILADMTARDLCQLLVYRSHCVDDNSWALVEHHPHLGLGGEQLWVGALQEGGRLWVGSRRGLLRALSAADRHPGTPDCPCRVPRQCSRWSVRAPAAALLLSPPLPCSRPSPLWCSQNLTLGCSEQ